jgi:FAD/FMN-containing dehydrogenase
VRPTVGIAGFILGGGFGGFTRFAGLGADNLIAIRGVDANGNTIIADKDNNPELLWASRGAGGGKFVIVTDFHVRLMDVSSGGCGFFPLTVFTLPCHSRLNITPPFVGKLVWRACPLFGPASKSALLHVVWGARSHTTVF